MASKVHGQYFTPYHISKMMAKMIIGAEEEGPHIISEPTCGSGANIVAAANVMKENGFNYQQNAYFIAQDMDSLVAKMCFVQMALLGIPGVVIIGNTLDVNTKGMEHWYTPFHFLFGTWILQRHKRKLKKNQIEQKSNIAEQKDNWLLELVGLA